MVFVGAATVTIAAPSRSTEAMAQHVREHFTVARFDAWVGDPMTKPGARLLYGSGVSAVESSAPGVAARLGALAAAGLVRLHSKRVARSDGDREYPFDFFVVRAAVPVPAGWPVVVALPTRKGPGLGKRELLAMAARYNGTAS